MELPSRDKNGICYLSYSAINTFLKDKNQFIKTYILKDPFIGNEYTEFGVKVGKAIESNNYELFNDNEIKILNKVTRLDLFEKKTIINYDSFYIIGYIDSCSSDLTKIIDYKTGGRFKEYQYYDNDYVQLCYYAIGIKQEYGIIVKEASVEFIRRIGSLKTGLFVSNEDPIKININIEEKRLSNVYYTTIKIAKEIECFYKNYIKLNNI